MNHSRIFPSPWPRRDAKDEEPGDVAEPRLTHFFLGVRFGTRSVSVVAGRRVASFGGTNWPVRESRTTLCVFAMLLTSPRSGQ